MSMKNVIDLYPLSPAQQGMLFHTVYAPGSGAYFEQLSCTLRGPLDAARFRAAWARAVDRHAALRTALVWEGVPEPVQVIHRRVELPWREQDWRGLPEAGRGARFEDFLRADRARGFDLSRPPLMRWELIRLGEEEFKFVWSFHHAVLDGWSMQLVVKEVLGLYEAAGGAAAGLPSPPPFRQFVAWVRRQDEAGAAAFWRRTLEGLNGPTPLGVDRAAAAPVPARDDDWRTREASLSADETSALWSLARRQRVTPGTLVQGAWALLLSRYSGSRDVTFGVTVSGRGAELEGVERAVGLLINTRPLRAEVVPEMPLAEWLGRLQERQFEASRYEHAALSKIQEWAGVAKGVPLFESILVVENYPAGAAPGGRVGGVEACDFRFDEKTNYPLTILALPGAELTLRVIYDARRFDEPAVSRLLGHLTRLLRLMAEDPARKLSELDPLGDEERRQLLYGWNDTRADYGPAACLHELVERQAARTPELTAVVFEGERLTYAELNGRANQLARRLRREGVGADAPVAVLMERSVEMVVALLGILKAGGAYLPLDPAYPRERLELMLRDAGSPVVLTQERFAALAGAASPRPLSLDAAREELAAEGVENLENVASAQSLAYVIYTSGSTGTPKGAMLSHEGIHNRLLWMQETYGLDASDRVLQKTPYTFDVSVWEFFWPLMTGAALVVARPEGHKDNAYLAELISAQGVTTLHFVPSMLRAFVDEPGAAERCRGLRRVICSGEALPFDLQERFFARLGAELHNLYGPTEASVDVTYWACREADERKLVPIGRPVANTQIYLLSEDLRPAPRGAAGELYIGGVQLARGYLNRPALTAERFIPDPFGAEPGARLYKTGDLARWLDDGEIEFLGRADHQVKVRGFRIELGEIEAALLGHTSVREAVVVAHDGGDLGKRLVAYFVSDAADAPGVAELRASLKKTLPDYMVPAAFVRLERLPLSPNGKLDRRALPAPGGGRPESGEPYAAPRTEVELALCEVWQEVLKVERVGVRDDYFALGGDSILSLRVRSKAAERGVEFSLPELFANPTVEALAAAIAGEGGGASAEEEGTGRAAFELIAEADRALVGEDVEDAYPLTMLQAGMLFHGELRPDSSVYHDVFSYRLRGPFNVEALREATRGLVGRHAVLRTSFDVKNFGEHLQLVHRTAEVPVEVEDLSRLPADEHEAAFDAWFEDEKRRPFDWTQAPLLRFFVHLLDAETFQFTVSFHHAILDGWSVATMLTELFGSYCALLRGEVMAETEAPRVTFGDFVALEREALWSEEHRRFWAEKLNDFTLSALPRWESRPGAKGARRLRVRRVEIPSGLSDALKATAKGAGVPLKSLLLAAHTRVLSSLCGTSEVVTGLASNGRPEAAGSERVLGLFLNTLPLRLKAGGGEWGGLARACWEAEREAVEHRRYPLAQTAKELGGGELFEAAFNFTHFHVYQSLAGLSDLRLVGEKYHEETNFVLLANFEQDPASGRVGLRLDYDSSELTDAQAEAVAGYYEAALRGAAEGAGARYERQALLGEAERHRLLHGWNETPRPQASGKCLHELFEEQARRRPEATAVVFGDERITYSELNARANDVARRLRREGVGPDVLVGLFMERSAEMLAALLGILKAGGAYVPLDPSAPEARLRAMVEDSGMSVLLTQGGLWPDAAAAEFGVRVLRLDEGHQEDSSEPAEGAGVRVTADNLAYVIYTSGSTGVPKGVPVPHSNVVRLFEATGEWFGFDEGDVWTLFHTHAFDFSVWEIWGALLYGGRLVVVPRSISRAPDLFRQLLGRERVTVLNQTPSAFRQLARADEQADGGLALRLVIFGGEALELQSLRPWFERHGDERPRLVNMYGITETTVHVTYRPVGFEDVAAGAGSIIGRPIPDLQIYLLDKHMQPAPFGTPGEIYVGGAGLARGYLNRPELTAERFVPDPFSGAAGARLYRSGDLARRLPDGEIEYVGRADAQLKVRGYRIEPGDIEAALLSHPSAREAVVVAREDQPGDKRLVAYFVAAEGTEPAANELRRHLSALLPDYMVPSAFVALERLPLTPNGKLDRRALPAPGGERPEACEEYVAPRTAVEAALCEVWQEVLGVERVGVRDDYFALGGDSILSLRVRSKAAERGVEFSLPELFANPNVEALARVAVMEGGGAGAEGRGADDEVGAVEAFALVSEADRARLGEDVEDAYPLTMLQAGMLFHGELQPDASLYHNVTAVRLRAPFVAENLRRALRSLLERHAVLRTSFDLTTFGEPLQLVRRGVELPLQVVDLRDLAAPEQAAALKSWAEEEKRRPFDWTQAPLLRFSVHLLEDETFQFTLTEHHAILDGWSVATMLTELFGSYCALLRGEVMAETEAPRVTFRDFVALEREALWSEEHRRFWAEKLAGNVARRLPRVAAHGRDERAREVRVREVAVSPELSDALKASAKGAGVPLKSLLLAAHARVLSSLFGSADVVTGFASNGRPEAAGSERVLGLFLNMLPLRLNAGGGEWGGLARACWEAEQEAGEHRRYPLAQMAKEAGGGELFEAAFNFTHFHVYQSLRRVEGVEVLGVDFFQNTNFVLLASFEQDPASGRVGLRLDYDSSELSAEQMEAVAGYYEAALRGAAEGGSYERRALLGAAERRRVLREWNDTRRPYPHDKCIHELFEEQAAVRPYAVAVVCEEEELTYSELNERADALARVLRRRGVGADERVGLLMERSVEMVVGLLAVLKAGGAYVPLDPSAPEARLRAMVEDSGVRVLLTQTRLWNSAAAGQGPHVICVDEQEAEPEGVRDEGARAEASADNLAYVIYTSGSTGVPKGVAVTHRSVARLVKGTEYASFDADEVFLQMAPVSFDASTFEIWGALLNGARLVLMPPQASPLEIGRVLARHGVTTMWLTAGLFHLMVDERLEDLRPLRQLLAGGDVLSVPHVRRVLESLPGCRVINGYGPTESTTFACCHPMTRGEQLQGTVPIGRPIANTQVYLLDAFLQPVPVGTPGQLYIGGDGLARGYLNRPALTADKFIPDPFSAEPGARLYATGDLARHLPDGRVEFLGREDYQVKVRGFRIELGEIEAALVEHASVREAVVVAREEAGAEKRLVAYVVSPHDPAPTAGELREHLRRRLPDYMTPALFVALERLPLTPNGKVDRRRLPAPGGERPLAEKSFRRPRTQVEEVLAAMWAQALKVERVGADDDFFELGGDSLRATQLIAQVRDAFQVQVPLRCLYEQPAVAGFAEALATHEAVPGQVAATARLLKMIEQMPAAEIWERLQKKTNETEAATYGD